MIDPVLRELDRRGLIEYVRPSRVPHDSVPALVQGVDIVVDQILTGSYGVTAVEAMASGRLVVGYLGPAVRALLPEQPPIVDADPSRFPEVILQIIDDRTSFLASAAAGPGYVEAWHSGRVSALALSTFLKSA